jgi:two-component system, OmpR family, sensor kinase
MAILLLSLTVATVLTFSLLLQQGRRDIDQAITREQERFGQAVGQLVVDARQDAPEATTDELVETAVRRYLQLNPATETYWMTVTLADGRRLSPTGGPSELRALFDANTLPQGPSGQLVTVGSPVGSVRTSTTPVQIAGTEVATVHLVAPLRQVREDAAGATSVVVIAAAFSLVIGGGLLATSLWRSLSPLGELAEAARSIELESLTARVDVGDPDDEVGALAQEFNRMLERLEEAATRQRWFMASIGHELRTPITIARGHLELLTRTAAEDPGAIADTSAIVEDELERMGALVEDLMAIARSASDDFLRRQPVELVAWFEELELKLAGHPAAGSVRVLPPPPVTIDADPVRLAQAVLNLVSNAHAHTPAGTDIRVRARQTDDTLVLVVADDGPGIPEEIRDHVRDPFVRAGDVQTSTGLGLSVVEVIVEAHGGRMTIDTGGDGTSVGLHLPMRSGDPAAGRLEPEDVGAG